MTLERVQKSNQIGFLLRGKDNIETHFIKADDVRQRRGRTIVKVRRMACNPSQDATFHLSDVRPLPTN